jgi:peptide/nickel transport system permease protein
MNIYGETPRNIMEAENKGEHKRKSQVLAIWRRFRRNPIAMTGLGIIIAMFILAALADVIAPGTEMHPGYDMQDWNIIRQFPSAEHIFGTDHQGRDLFGRIAHGARITLLVGFVVVSISMVAGVTLGSIAGFYGKITDNIIMRVVDILLAMPTIVLAIAISAALRDTGLSGLTTVMIAVGVGAIPGYARITRAQVLTIREQEYVEAARSVGASDFRIIRKHVLPNAIAPIIVEATMGMAGAIASAAALSFLGLGLSPPTPEWGAMLSDGRRFMLAGYWHMTVFPGAAIAMIIFSLNMMGDGLRDALDPKLRSGGFSKKRFKRMLENKKAIAAMKADKEKEGGAGDGK